MSTLRAAREFQEQVVAELMKESFEQLSNRPIRQRLPVPPNLSGISMSVLKKCIQEGVLEIEVELKRRFWLVFTGNLTTGFQIRLDGRIIPRRVSTYEYDTNAGVSKGNLSGLPVNIEHELVEYLRLEFGEDESDPDALKLSDLKYEGKFLVDGMPTHFWRLPEANQQSWATVEIAEDGYRLATVAKPPA